MAADGSARFSISSEFSRGYSIRQELENTTLCSSTPEFQAKLRDAIACFERVDRLVDQLHLVSSNELAEDVNTGDLKYLLAPCLAAELFLQLVTNDGFSRLQILEATKSDFCRFLETMERLELMGPEDKRALRQERMTPEEMRNNKIARFKREKMISSKLAAIAKKKTKRSKGGNGDHYGSDGDDDEELERDEWLLLLESAIGRALNQLRLGDQEVAILAAMHSAAPGTASAPVPPPAPARADPSLAISASMMAGRSREEMRAQVFRAGHRPPLHPSQVPLDDLVSIAQPEPPKNPADDDSEHEDVCERKTVKARNWDDWKDDNPPVGNTIR